MATDYQIPNDADIAAADKYAITLRDEGQIDSVQSVKTMLDDIVEALFLKRDKQALESAGANSGNVSLDPNYPSPSADEQTAYGENPSRKYVTTLHYHPTPVWVNNAVHASGATLADRAESAAAADKLEPGANINGHLFTGEDGHDITLTAHDIDRVPKVYWGTVDPGEYTGFSDLRDGDLYVKVFN